MGSGDVKPAVGVIGFGRFGPVLARLLVPGHEVLVYDIVDVREQAAEVGVRAVSREEIFRVDTLFLAVPISRFKEVVAELVPRVKPGVTVFDVCSVKVYPVTVMREHFPPEVTIIASHPLFGPDSSRQGFRDLPLVLYPVTERSAVFEQWVRYFREQGVRVIEMEPEEHDRLAARSQGVTHFVGRALKAFGIQATPIDTEGFRDLQLVVDQTCYDSFELFRDLENFNPYTTEMIDHFLEAVEGIKQAIIRRD